MLSGLSTINCELTNKCQKRCAMCGRRKAEKEGYVFNEDMPLDLIKIIAAQLPRNIIVQLHNNGESFLYEHLHQAIALFKNQITSFNTNGKLLVEKGHLIIDHLDTLAISIIQDDPEHAEQFEIIKEFMKMKGDKKPLTTFRLLGRVDPEPYKKLNPYLIVTRVLHSPKGSYDYESEVIKPEHGICNEIISHPAINVHGDVSVCVRYDLEGKGILGNLYKQSLDEIWNSYQRQLWLQYHIQGRRQEVPLCSKCTYWGCPTGYNYKDSIEGK